MQPSLGRVGTWAILLAAAGAGPVLASRRSIWQADVRIRTIEVTKSGSRLSAVIDVTSEQRDDALDVRLLVLLPVGVGVEELGPECSASPGPSMVPSLRAAVTCNLGVIANRGHHEVVVSTTLPPDARIRRFGAFAYSVTPDPVPGNNYAERTFP